MVRDGERQRDRPKEPARGAQLRRFLGLGSNTSLRWRSIDPRTALAEGSRATLARWDRYWIMVVHGYLVRVPSVQRFEEARYSLIEQDIADARASGRPRQQFPSAEEMQALCLLRNATEAASRAAGSGGFIGVFSLQDGLKVAEVLSMLDQLEARQRFGVPRGFGNLEIRVLPLPHGLVQSAEYPDAWCSPRT